MYRQLGKNLLNSNISSTSFHNTVNFGPLPGDISWRVCGTPANFNGFCELDCYCSNVAHPNFAQRLAVSWMGTLYIHFWQLLPPDGILLGAKFTLRPSFAFSYIGSIAVWHSSSGVSQTLQR